MSLPKLKNLRFFCTANQDVIRKILPGYNPSKHPGFLYENQKDLLFGYALNRTWENLEFRLI